MAAMLIAALGWPSTAGATSRVAPSAEAPAAAAPESGAEPPAPTPEPTPKVELTPEEKERQRLALLLDQATLHWKEGRRLFENGRYAEAAVEFEGSYAAVPAPATLYSQALSYKQAGKPVEAVRAYQRYLALPSCDDVPPPERNPDECPLRRPEAEKALTEQRQLVGELTLSLAEGVRLRDVRVDGRSIPLDDFPLLLLPGTVDVEVLGLGPDDRRRKPASITGGEVTSFYVAPFEPETPPVVTDTDDTVVTRPDPRRQRALMIGFGVSAGLTLVSGAATGVLGGLTFYHQRRFNAEICEDPCPPGANKPYPADHEAKFERYKPITNALVGVTVGLAVATALLAAFAFGKSPSKGKALARARVRRHVGLGGSGLVVRW